MRAVLYERHKYDLDCPTEEKCHLFANHGGYKACSGCPKELKVKPPELDERYLPRVKYLARIDNMISIGCKFGPNDLPPEVWDQLILLAQERSWIREKVDKQKNKRDPNSGLSKEGKAALEKQRKELGVPAPGQSIFPLRVKRQ
jgi:hypothetical protein